MLLMLCTVSVQTNNVTVRVCVYTTMYTKTGTQQDQECTSACVDHYPQQYVLITRLTLG